MSGSPADNKEGNNEYLFIIYFHNFILPILQKAQGAIHVLSCLEDTSKQHCQSKLRDRIWPKIMKED